MFMGKRDVMGMARQSGLKESDINVLEDGMRVPVGNHHIEIIETPGHTPGSCCFRLGKKSSSEGILFTGDTLFVGSCGRSDLPESDPRHLHSLARLSKLPGMILFFLTSCPSESIYDRQRSRDKHNDSSSITFLERNLSRSETSCYKLPNYVETCRKVFKGFACQTFAASALMALYPCIGRAL